MAEVSFGTGKEETGSFSGEEAVVTGPIIETDGDRMTVTVTPEQAEAVRKLLAEEKDGKKEEEKKPEWLGEFKSPEDLAKAYQELRKKMSEGKKTDETPPVKTDETTKTEGIDLSKYSEEWSVNNGLSEESYAELAKAGYTKDIVDNYIAGRIATVTKQTETLYGAVGGKEAYEALIEWGKANITRESQVAYDRLLQSGNYEAAALALRGFVQQYEAAEGTDPRATITAGRQSGTTAAGFANKSDMIAAINDRRYKNGDKAYIAEVERRILASRF